MDLTEEAEDAPPAPEDAPPAPEAPVPLNIAILNAMTAQQQHAFDMLTAQQAQLSELLSAVIRQEPMGI